MYSLSSTNKIVVSNSKLKLNVHFLMSITASYLASHKWSKTAVVVDTGSLVYIKQSLQFVLGFLKRTHGQRQDTAMSLGNASLIRGWDFVKLKTVGQGA